MDYICAIHHDVQKANDALTAGEKHYQELQRSYLADKALMVELARAFSDVLTIVGGMGDSGMVECKLSLELIREFLERTRPLVVARGVDELAGKRPVNPFTFEHSTHMKRWVDSSENGLISREQVLNAVGFDPKDIARGMSIPKEFIDPNKEK